MNPSRSELLYGVTGPSESEDEWLSSQDSAVEGVEATRLCDEKKGRDDVRGENSMTDDAAFMLA
jgi:hypothetical protein